MKINFCPSCGAQIHGMVRFCPKCGSDFRKFIKNEIHNPANDFRMDLQNFIENFIESNADLLKELAARVERGEGFEKGAFFSVEMRGDKPIIKGGDIKDLEKILKSSSFSCPFKMPDGSVKEMEFREARAEIVDDEGRKKVIVMLPGVSSLRDVTINKISEGLEIIGKGDRTIYFSKITLQGDFEIKATRLDRDILTVEVK